MSRELRVKTSLLIVGGASEKVSSKKRTMAEKQRIPIWMERQFFEEIRVNVPLINEKSESVNEE